MKCQECQTIFEGNFCPNCGTKADGNGSNKDVFDITTRDGTLILMDDVKNLYNHFSKEYLRMSSLQTEIETLSNYRGKKTLVFLILAILFSVTCFIGIFTAGIQMAGPIFCVEALPFYILFFCFNSKDKKTRKANEISISTKMDEINHIVEKITTEYYTFDVSNYYPIDYFYDYAMDAIIQYLNQFRAESLKEAINLYEREAHQRRLEEQQEKSINIQKEILNKANKAANAATATAVFSGISAYNSVKIKKSVKNINDKL